MKKSRMVSRDAEILHVGPRQNDGFLSHALQNPSTSDLNGTISSLYALLVYSSNTTVQSLGICPPPSADGVGWIKSSSQVSKSRRCDELIQTIQPISTNQPIVNQPSYLLVSSPTCNAFELKCVVIMMTSTRLPMSSAISVPY